MTRPPPFAPGQVWVSATERRRILVVDRSDPKKLDFPVQYQIDGQRPITIGRNPLRRWATRAGAKLEGSDDA